MDPSASAAAGSQSKDSFLLGWPDRGIDITTNIALQCRKFTKTDKTPTSLEHVWSGRQLSFVFLERKRLNDILRIVVKKSVFHQGNRNFV